MAIFSRIIGTGSYLPDNIVTNDELSKIVDTSDSWIRSRTGITQRHIVTDEKCSDLAYQAAKNALETANFDITKLQAIIVATTTSDKRFPSVACTIQHRLGANGCCAFDVQAVCAGFPYAVATANAFIRSGQFDNVLVVGSETMSKLMNWEDRNSCVLFGDGAGAILLQKDNQPGIINTILRADGQHEEMLHAPYVKNDKYDNIAYLTMQGNQVFKIAVNAMGKLVDETLTQAGMEYHELDWLVPHQANKRIIKGISKKLKLPMEQVIMTIDKHANTSAASIPLAFDQAVKENKIKPNQSCLMVAFGGGFTWGSILLRL